MDELPAKPAAVLKGTARGLEALLDGGAPIDAIATALTRRLEEAPGFFRGSDVRVRVEDGPLAAGGLARLDEIASRFELRIVEIAAAKKLADVDAVPRPSFAAGSAPSPASAAAEFEEEPTQLGRSSLEPRIPILEPPTEPAMLAQEELELTELIQLVEEPAVSFEEPTQTAVPLALASTAEIELETSTQGPRLVVGPVRSGVILEHTGHLIVFGDINPGAEVRASGNIVVLGRLRGTAHAGIGQDVGFILALRLEPQQLRIGRRVARAADSDTPGTDAEIAYCTGDAIVVERYHGKLPKNLATSI